MKRILVQLDTDAQPSVFDAIVAIDAGVDQLLRQAGVVPDQVEPLVHGAIFTRGLDDLKHTAIFIGGSRLEDGEAVLERVQAAFFGPFRVSVLLDSNGANTTAAAAVLRVGQHVTLGDCRVLVLGGTGPVGRRVARLLAGEGAHVLLGSRKRERAEQAWQAIQQAVPGARGEPCETGQRDQLRELLASVQAVIAAGAAGVQLLPADAWQGQAELRVAVDLNAVPPAGIEGIEPGDKATERHGVLCYGAIGVGGLKMRIHRRAIQRLFETNDAVLDAEAIYALGKELLG